MQLIIRALRIDDNGTARAYILFTMLALAALLAMLPEAGAMKPG